MKQAFFALFVSVFSAHAAPLPDLDFRSQRAEAPLTGERAAELAPELLNPATRAWVVESQWDWEAELRQLKVTATLHVRQETACRARAEKEGQEALKSLRAFAAARASTIRALASNPYRFRRWADSARLQWLQSAAVSGTPCKTESVASTTSAPSSAAKPTLLARAPMRLWDGRPSVRAALSAGGVTINGHFLVDVGAAQSSVSPLFLDFQGIPTDWFADPERPARILPWTYRYEAEGFASDEGQADRIDVAGQELPPKFFRITESEIADTPRSTGACCDGVLGMDALRSYPVEWRMDEPYELLFWKREGFHPGAEFVAIPVEESAPGVLMTPGCVLENPVRKQKLSSVRWLTSFSGALEFSLPHAALAQGGGVWNLQCASATGSSTTPVVIAQIPTAGAGSGITRARLPQWGSKAHFPESDARPAVAVGAATLLRGRVILDLPHGKLWFHREVLAAQSAVGDWGGKLDVRVIDGERTIWWARSANLDRFWRLDTEATPLAPPVGKWVRLRTVNGKDPGGLDLSVVERVFRGLGQNAGARLDAGKLEVVWGDPQSSSRWKARSSSQR